MTRGAWSGGKGSAYRPTDRAKWDEGYDRAFKKSPGPQLISGLKGLHDRLTKTKARNKRR